VRIATIRDEAGREIVRARVADRFWPRFRGLMLRRSLPEGEGVLFPHCDSIHTFGMLFNLDVVFLRDNTVARLIEDLPQNRVRAEKGCDVLELPAGRAGALGLAVGQHLTVERSVA